MPKLNQHLANLPAELARAIWMEYSNLAKHISLCEWGDAQVDAGRFSEAVLRVLEWAMSGKYTPIDGQQKPIRKTVTGKAANDTTLAPSLRFQIPTITELLMDFRNNRNAAHLGNIDPGNIDGRTTLQLASWLLAELGRLFGSATEKETQALLNELAQQPTSLVYEVAGTKVILDPSMSASNKILVMLASQGGMAETGQLVKWTEYKNSSRMRTIVLKQLASKKLVHLDRENVYLLPAGSKQADEIILNNTYNTR